MKNNTRIMIISHEIKISNYFY